MAGMEELEIHSRSYLVRWINVSPEHTISWSLQPHKKSLNFGIFKHPGTSGIALTSASSTHSGSDLNDSSRTSSSSPSVVEKLKGIGLKSIEWIGKCEADKISQGTYDVRSNEGGNYALVFDNTFSKQVSKTVTFVLLTYATNCPPRSGHQVHHSQVVGGSSLGPALALRPSAANSTESLRQHGRLRSRSIAHENSMAPPQSSGSVSSQSVSVHTGILHKRRRRRHQGYARRFFTLDFNTFTLSYYHDRNSSALRGSIPLSLAAIATNEHNREISIDSGAEIWHLRALNNQDFKIWKIALERASKQQDTVPTDTKLKVRTAPLRRESQYNGIFRNRKGIEKLVESVSASRDKVRQLAKDTDPKYLVYGSENDGPSGSVPRLPDDFADGKEKKSFWKMKGKNDNNGLVTPRSGPSQYSTPMGSETSINGGSKHSLTSKIHDELMMLFNDLNSVVCEFNKLMAEKKPLASPLAPSIRTMASIESDMSEEFFDATDGNGSPLLTMHTDSEEEDAKSVSAGTAIDEDAVSSAGSDEDDRDGFLRDEFTPDGSSSLFPVKPKSLSPLPLKDAIHRDHIPPPIGLPPSLISFLRKNVGKDLSTISMPVTANEPLSLLQRAAEHFEYSHLLDEAASSTDGLERLIYVTAFAISPFSNLRIRERSIRKPFNPMLGETFELVRPDKGLRFIAEKVSHRPVQLACQADTKDWSFSQSPKPTQKFWGKSVEVITEGKARVTLNPSGEHFSWSPGTSFLRNIIAGDKYVEPAGEMCVVNETTGQKAIITFKAGGMFSGRSEELAVKAYGPHGEELPLGLQGTWSTSLQLTEHGNKTNKTIWKAGPLVDDPQKHYGFPVFTASLNEITSIEEGKLPPTDSRLRPDQRALEDGKVDDAEALKAVLEERQRGRRAEMEAAGEIWTPRWFNKVELNGGSGQVEDSPWRLRSGKDGYWEERAKGEWPQVVPVFKI
ncbi:hypothetical protein FQN57_005638 [Myotisia sp. PD_48]|nr:hypothetical protein FQN57_005638 [Myotisia sp. PD_48]